MEHCTEVIDLFLKTLYKNLKFLCKNDLWDIKRASEWATLETIPEIRKLRLFNEMQQHKLLSLNADILNYNDSIDYIIDNKCSLCRFGDGEFNLINGGDVSFQKYNPQLAQRLREILKSCFDSSDLNSNIRIAISRLYYNFSDWNNLIFPRFFEEFVFVNEDFLAEVCNPKYTYISTEISQLYHIFREYDFASYFDHIKEIWKDRDIAIICGDRIFNNIENNIFDCAKSTEYIYAPTTEAFNQYDEILNKAKKNSKEKLVIAILGPTAKLLAWDLFTLGYQALDFGHIAKDYDSFMNKEPRNIESVTKFFDKD